MIGVLACWVVAMIAGLNWGRLATGACVSLTLLAFLWVRGPSLATWSGWLQFLTLGVTPWLLDAERRRSELRLQAEQTEEQRRLLHLSEVARELLTTQGATKQLETQIAEITDVYHVTKATSSALHLEELFTATLQLLPRLLDVRGLRLMDVSGESPTVLRARRDADGQLAAQRGGAPTPAEQALLDRARTSGEAGSASAGEPGEPGRTEGPGRLHWVPLWREQKLIGLLIGEDVPSTDGKTLAIIANQLSLQLSRIHLYQAVEALAVTDALTGLFVRGYFMERSQEELERCRRHALSCTLLMVDLDHFKEKNDTHGHLVGDLVLKDVAALLQRNLREIDLIARFGGEEFILLLLETDAEQARPVAQRLKQLVEVHPIRAYDELLSQTVSIGLAEFPRDATDLGQLIERADAALYAAKRAGRNQVVSWSKDISSARPQQTGVS